MSVVVAGEALIDLVPAPAGDLDAHPGGGPFNTARWLGRLGTPTGFLGALADDAFGRRLRASLREADVSLHSVIETRLPTTLALAELDDEGAARYSFYSEGTSMRDVHASQIRLPEDLDALCVGSIGLILEPIASAIGVAVEIAHGRGALVMLDPNVRASLIEDRARYMDRLESVLARTDVLKLSAEDAAWLVPGEHPVDAARALGARGPRVVLLTEGGSGATVLAGDTPAHFPAAQVDVVDTIGAGDAFSAGFLASWLRAGFAPGAVLDACQFALRVAALACSMPGATPPATLVS